MNYTSSQDFFTLPLCLPLRVCELKGNRNTGGQQKYGPAWLTDDHSPKLNMQHFLLLLSHTELPIFNILCKTNEEVRCFFKMPSDFKNYDGSLVDCVFKSSHDNIGSSNVDMFFAIKIRCTPDYGNGNKGTGGQRKRDKRKRNGKWWEGNDKVKVSSKSIPVSHLSLLYFCFLSKFYFALYLLYWCQKLF